MSAATPGRWIAIEVGQGGPADNPMPVYEIQSADGRCVIAEYVDEHAHLLAAAPELLDALKELVSCKDLKDRAEAVSFAGPLSEFGENWKTAYDRMRADYLRRQPLAWEAARAAIQKATKEPS